MNRLPNFESEEQQALLTAYALGELDAQEQAQVESLLAASPPARAQLEELRGLNAALLAARQQEPLSPRSACLRLDVLGKLAELQGESKTITHRPIAHSTGTGGTRSAAPRLAALAASLVFTGGLVWALLSGGGIDPAQEKIAQQLGYYDRLMQTGRYEEALAVAEQIDRQVAESDLTQATLEQMIRQNLSPTTSELLTDTGESVNPPGRPHAVVEAMTVRALANELARLEGSPVDGGASVVSPQEALAEAVTQQRLARVLAGRELQLERLGGSPLSLQAVEEAAIPFENLSGGSPSETPLPGTDHVGPRLRFIPPGEHPYVEDFFEALPPTRPGTVAALPRPADGDFPAPGLPMGPDMLEEGGTASYDQRLENPWLSPRNAPLSTFSADVDTASYANVRRFLTENQLPPTAAVRVEEFVNYFDYNYAPPPAATDDAAPVPFAVYTEVAACPWNAEHQLVRIGLRGRDVPIDDRPASNLVFLIDVSGSMGDLGKLALVKEAMLLLTEELNENDTVTIIAYAGHTGVRLKPTPGSEKETIRAAIESLEPGGRTYGEEGIRTAYDFAAENFLPEGTNRILWATDGDLNVGQTSNEELIELASTRAEEGVFLTVLGVGRDNLQDDKLEGIANNANGQYAYLDSLYEARKVLVHDLSGTLITIAQDVKLQVEFNPEHVAAYRLIGYENRLLAAEDFDDDTKDAGEIGAGHTVTALYELIPPEAPEDAQSAPVDDSQGAAEHFPLRYQTPVPSELTEAASSEELFVLALRYKEPTGDESRRLEYTQSVSDTPFGQASEDFRFAAAAAAFAMLLRESEYAGDATFTAVEEYATGATGDDADRLEFLDLVRQAGVLTFEGIGGDQPPHETPETE